MTITLNLSPETERTLLAQAEARGLSLDAFLQTIITNQATADEAMKPLQSLSCKNEDLERLIDEVFDAVYVPPGVGRGAMRRENWYR